MGTACRSLKTSAAGRSSTSNRLASAASRRCREVCTLVWTLRRFRATSCSAGRKREYIERIKKHPLARALRLDKMTLAALHATLSAYLDAEIAVREIPTLAMLSASEDELHAKALRLQKALADTGVSSQLVWTGDAVGGGSAPAQELTGWAVAIEPGRLSVDELEEKLRLRAKPIVARIHRRQYLLCVRTIREEDFAEIAAAAAEAIR